MTQHFPAPAAADIARTLLQYHPDLTQVRIEFVFRDEAVKKDGVVTWGRAHKVTGFKAMLATSDAGTSDGCDFYVIELAHDVWKLITEAQRIALVDHELCHLALSVTDSGRKKLGMRPHDVEEFIEIIQRHGAWRPDIADLMAAAGPVQLRLIADSIDDLGRTTYETAPEAVVPDSEEAADAAADAELDAAEEQKITDVQRSVLGLRDDDGTPPPAPAAPPDDTELALRARPIVVTTQVASVNLVMRRLHVGEDTANRVLGILEADGIVGPAEGKKPRQVLVRPDGSDDPLPL